MENDKKKNDKKAERDILDAQIRQHVLSGKDIKDQLNALAAKAGITDVNAFIKGHAKGSVKEAGLETKKVLYAGPIDDDGTFSPKNITEQPNASTFFKIIIDEKEPHMATVEFYNTATLKNALNSPDVYTLPLFEAQFAPGSDMDVLRRVSAKIHTIKPAILRKAGESWTTVAKGEIAYDQKSYDAFAKENAKMAEAESKIEPKGKEPEPKKENADAFQKNSSLVIPETNVIVEKNIPAVGDTIDKVNPAFDSLVTLLRQAVEEEKKLALTEKLSSSLMSQQKRETAISKHEKKISGFKEKISAIEKDLSPEEVKRAEALAVPEAVIEAEEKKDAVVEKEPEVHIPEIQPRAANPEEAQAISSNEASGEKEKTAAVKEETTEPTAVAPLKKEETEQMSDWEKYEAYKEQIREHSRRYIQARDDLSAFFARADKEQMPAQERETERQEWQARIDAIQHEMKNWDKGPLDDAVAQKLYHSVYGETRIEMKSDKVEASRAAYTAYLAEHKLTKESYVSKKGLSLKEAYDRARVELGYAMLSTKHTELVLENTPSETLDQLIAEYKSTEIYQRVHVEEYAAMQEFKASQLPTKRAAWFRTAMNKTLKLVAKPMAVWHSWGNWGKEFKFRTGKDADGNPVYFTYRFGQLVRSGVTGAVSALFGAGIGTAAHFTVKLARGTVIAAGGGIALSKLQTAHEKTMRDIESKREAAVQAYKNEDANLDAFERTMETLDAEQKAAERKLRLKQIGIGALMGAANFAAVQAENTAFATHVPGQTPVTRLAAPKGEQPITDQHLPKMEPKAPHAGITSGTDKLIEQKGAPTVPVEQPRAVIPKEAIIDGKRTTGITWAMKYQFEKNPEIAEKLGYTAAPNKAKFLADYARKLGYISEDNTEVRIAHVGGAYVINPDGSVTEYAPDGSAVETHVQGQPFNAAAIQKDQYLWRKNPMLKDHHPAPSPEETHAGATPASEPHTSEAAAPVTSPRATFDHPSSPASPTVGSPYETGVPASQEQLAAVASAKTTASIDQLFGRRTFWGRVVPGERSDEWKAMRNVKMSTVMDTGKKSFSDAQMPKVVALRSFAKSSGVAPGTMSVEAYMKRVAEMEAQSASA